EMLAHDPPAFVDLNTCGVPKPLTEAYTTFAFVGSTTMSVTKRAGNGLGDLSLQFPTTLPPPFVVTSIRPLSIPAYTTFGLLGASATALMQQEKPLFCNGKCGLNWLNWPPELVDR